MKCFPLLQASQATRRFLERGRICENLPAPCGFGKLEGGGKRLFKNYLGPFCVPRRAPRYGGQGGAARVASLLVGIAPQAPAIQRSTKKRSLARIVVRFGPICFGATSPPRAPPIALPRSQFRLKQLFKLALWDSRSRMPRLRRRRDFGRWQRAREESSLSRLRRNDRRINDGMRQNQGVIFLC